MPTRKLLTAMALSFMALSAAAVPIDCSKASKPDERTICSDPFLLQTDARLDTLYDISLHMVAMGERGDLVDGQRQWIKDRETCGTDKNCLRAAYAKRSAIYQAILERVESHGPF